MDKVMVPSKLTDAMRDAMTYFIEGPVSDYDEHWTALLNAAYTGPYRWSPEGAHLVTDLRYARSQALTAYIMQIVGKYICDHGDRDGHANCSRDLMEIFYKVGVEIIADAERAEAGLPPRDERGWTAQELAAMEARRLEFMSRPIQMTIGSLKSQD